MGIVIYGSKQIPINIDEALIWCPSCKANSWADVMVLSTYYHFYWIPIFPFEKTADVTCKKCGLHRSGRAFDASLLNNYNEISRNFRHPLFTYFGVAIMMFVIMGVLLSAV